MGQQHRKVTKRRRRHAYLQRKKERARNGVPLKPSRSEEAPIKAAAKKAPAKKAAAKKAKSETA